MNHSDTLQAVLDHHSTVFKRSLELVQEIVGKVHLLKTCFFSFEENFYKAGLGTFMDMYLQISLDAESKKITTINTHRGLYQYNCLPFEVSSAPAIFQRITENILLFLQS